MAIQPKDKMRKLNFKSMFTKMAAACVLPLLFSVAAKAQTITDSTYINLDDKFKNGLCVVDTVANEIKAVPAHALQYSPDKTTSTYYAYDYERDSVSILKTDFNIAITPQGDKVKVINDSKIRFKFEYPENMTQKQALETKFMVDVGVCPTPAPHSKN